MPKTYRVMVAERNRPKIGETAVTLGVRIPTDIAPDASGNVRQGIGGMSVSPSLRDLPLHRIPTRLRHLAPDAGGKNEHFVWSMGEGEFKPGPVAKKLQLREEYQEALRATQPQWSVDEE